MSQLSDYLEGQLRAHIFRTASFTKPTALWVSLHTANPADAGTGTEVSGGNYGRVNLAPLDANWAGTVDGVTSNLAAITFPTPSADWGTSGTPVTHFGIWDAQTTGNLLYYGALTNSKVIGNGDPAPSFAVGTLTVTCINQTTGTVYLGNQVRQHIFRTASFTKPTVLAVALHTADPGASGAGAEVSGGSYARVGRNPLDANWTAASSTDGVTDNAAALTFPSPTANWGLCAYVAVWDNATAGAGNCLVRGALTTPKNVNSGDAAPSIGVGALDVTFA